MSVHLYLITAGSCLLIGVCSMFSLFVFSILINNQSSLSLRHTFDPNKSEILKTVLSFAVGGLLGDVFLHLLPEASGQLTQRGYDALQGQRFIGFWVIVGIILFTTFESLFVQLHHIFKSTKQESNGSSMNGKVQTLLPPPKKSSEISVTGYLNLLANCFDNFTHGMAVGASYLAGYKMGVLTSIAIAIHEIPHEIADYVILLRSGFTSWRALRAQLSISLVTVLGALAVLYFDETKNYTLWILPFTGGGFIYISLTSLLPEVIQLPELEQVKENKRNKLRFTNLVKLVQRLMFVVVGILVMAMVNMIDS